jgi:(p)ppGpp synthase/HD superfamily hydrolase
MRSYAQTNIQLFNQLRRDGYSDGDLNLVCNAYELAMVLFTGRFQPSGKSFIAHGVGTASILGFLRLPAAVVAAGLLHNVYEHGDFGDGHKSISRSKRLKITRVLGREVEECVARFPGLSWQWSTNLLARENPPELPSIDRAVLALVLADHLEHLLDLDLLYYSHAAQGSYLNECKIAVDVANRLSLCRLATEMREAIRNAEFAGLPVKVPEHRSRSFVVAPRSYCRHFSLVLRQGVMNRGGKRVKKFQSELSPSTRNCRIR